MQLRKTNHFWKRAWERGISMLTISKVERILLNNDKYKIPKKKTRLIIGQETMKELGIKSKASGLIIIIKEGYLLITTFFVDSISNYCKSNKEDIETILM